MFLGIDIGSAASKAVIIDQDKNVVTTLLKQQGVGGAGNIVNEICDQAGIKSDDIKYTVVTGYGRVVFKDADKQITELSCHAKGVANTVKEARTIIDIGGQDAKIIRIDDNGNILNFVMNDKCAAGTGRFLEVMARVLGCSVGELSDLAAGSDKEINISNTCAVFAESEVISRLAAGESRENIARGVHASVARRIAGLVKRVDACPVFAMTGGVAQNKDVVSEIEKSLGNKILVPENPQLMGALGAAIYAWENGNKK